MPIYEIPVNHIEDLTKKINQIKNKGADITFNIGKEVISKQKLSNGLIIGIKCYEVEVDGKYIIDNWEFVASIDHTEHGNIVRTASDKFANSVPNKYKTIGKECEHCNKIRDRKDTYLIFNNKTNEFKQVGKTCLMNYTNGLDANVCAHLSDVFSYINSLESTKSDFDEESFVRSGSNVMSNTILKKVAYGYVKANGYVPKSSADAIVQMLFNTDDRNFSEASDKEIATMDEWVKALDDSRNDYIYNARLAWFKDYVEYRDVALVASLMSVYLKELAKKEVINSKGGNVFVGNVGDKIIISDVKSIRVVYVKSGKQYSYYAPDVYVYEIHDAKGHTYIWSTSEMGLENKVNDIESIVATIKEHKEFRGVNQTIVTRCKVSYIKKQHDDTNIKNVMKELDELTESWN